MSDVPGWKGDPLLHLNDECVVHILSFVIDTKNNWSIRRPERPWYDPEEPTVKAARRGGTKRKCVTSEGEEKKRQLLGVRDVAKFYTCFAFLSHGWKTLIDASIARLVTLLEVNFDSLRPVAGEAGDCIDWVVRHKFKLASIQCIDDGPLGGSPRLRDIPLLLVLLIQCDTSGLETVQMKFVSEETRAIVPGEVVRPPSWQREAFSISIPPGQELCYLHCVLKTHCPNIKNYLINMRSEFPGARTQDGGLKLEVSPGIAELESVENLRLNLHIDAVITGGVITRVIGTISSTLQMLSLSCGSLKADVLNIHSKHLRKLYVEDFFDAVELSLDCPNLEVFRCKGTLESTTADDDEGEREWHVLHLRQKILRAESISETCVAHVRQLGEPHRGRLVEVPFADLLHEGV